MKWGPEAPSKEKKKGKSGGSFVACLLVRLNTVVDGSMEA